MADLIDFTESRENSYFDDQDENVPPSRAPDLAQSPVIVNSILKQCTKDNLIQLYTPVQKPVKGKLKVRFGSDSLLQTPVVKGDKCKVKASGEIVKDSKQEVPQQLTEEEENWIDRTSVLTKQEHEIYTEAARDILHHVISEMPIKEEAEPSSTGGEEDEEMCPMDVSECQPQIVVEEPPVSNEPENKLSDIELLLLQARSCLEDFGSCTPEKKVDATAKRCSDTNVDSENSKETGPCQSEHSNEKENVKEEECVAHIQDGEEPMDCEEAMEIDDESQAQPVEPIKDETERKDEVPREEEKIKDVETSESHKAEDTSDKDIDNDDDDDEVFFVKKVQDTIDRDRDNTKSDEELSQKSLESKDDSENVSKNKNMEDQTNSESNSKRGNEEVELSNGPAVTVEQKLKEQTKHDSSDEEFMSADEEVEEGKQKENLKIDEPTQDIKSEITKIEPESPERIPPKVGYSLNFDDLDTVNPFASKSAVANSPEVGKSQIIHSDNSKLVEQVEKPDITNTEQNKVDTTGEKGNMNKPVLEAKVEKIVEEEKNEKFQSANTSPEKENTKPAIDVPRTETPNKQKEEMSESEKTEVAPSPERVPPMVGYSLDFDSIDMMNPFATKSAIQNSPDIGKPKLKSQEPETVKDKTTEGANENIEKVDRPVNESKEENSENKETVEQLSTADTTSDQENEQNVSQKINTSISEASDLNTEQEKATVSEHSVISDIDPFKPKSQILNSPDKDMTNHISAEHDVDPQTAATENLDQIKESNAVKECTDNIKDKVTEPGNIDNSEDSNSKNQETVTMKKKQNPGNTETKVEAPATFDEEIPISKGVYNLDDIDFDSVDPFKPKKQMMNSPDIDKATPSKSEDPFKVTNQLANTPVGKNTTKESENEVEKEDKKQDQQDLTKPVDTPDTVSTGPVLTDETPLTDMEEIDPFKPRQQMQNSPVMNKSAEPAKLDNDTEIDPFKSRTQICNSPVHGKMAETEIDDNTPLDSINPFQSNSKIASSPDVKNKSQPTADAFEDLDPFKTKNTVAYSPQKEPVSQATDDVVNVVDSDKIDPFKPSNQMANSPIVDPFVTKSKIAESPVVGKVETPTPEQQGAIEDSSEGEEFVFEIQGVARQGEQPEGATIQQFGNCLNMDEQVFVPATEVFSAPGVWDMLEQFGNTNTDKEEESALSRMSLYVKFDPLVDAAPIKSINSRRISIRPAQLEKVKEYGLDETLLLLGTPPKKRSQSSTLSHLRNTPLGERNTPKMIKSLQNDSSTPGGVDKILAFSPSKENEQVEKAPISGFEPGLSLLSRATAEQEDTGLFQELKYTDSDLRRLRSELQLEFQGGMLAKQAEWKKHEEKLEKAIKAEQERTRAEEKRTDAVKGELTQMKEVVAKFEATFAELIDKNSHTDTRIEKMKKERDQALQDVVAVENAFSDLHRRYEKMKNILVSMQQNEEVLKKTVAEHLEKKKTMDASFQSLKKKAEENITKLSKENKRLQGEKDESTSTLEAKIQLLQLKIDSAEKKIEQKAEENKQLAEICDSLISKHEKHH